MRTITNTYVLMSAIRNLAFSAHAGIYVWYLAEHGMSPLQFNLINAVFYSASFFLEVPTGHIADRYGRRMSCLIGYMVAAVGMAVYGIVSDFWGFALAEFTIALGFCCISGSFDAWAYETARERGEDTIRMQRRGERVRYPMIMIGTVAGGALTGMWASFAWFVSAAGYLVLFAIAYRVMHGSASGCATEKEMPTLREVSQLRHDNPQLWQVCFAAMLFYGLVATPNMLWQPTLSDKGFVGPFASGVILSLSFGVAFVGSFLKRTPRLQVYYRGILILALIVFVVPLVPNYWSLMLFFLTQLPRAFVQAMDGMIANQVMGEFPRATGLSVVSAAGKMGGFVGLMLCGALAQVHLYLAWCVFAVVAVVLSVIALRKL